MTAGAEPGELPSWGLFAQWRDLIDRDGPTASLRRQGGERRMILSRRVADHRCPLAGAVAFYDRWWRSATPGVPEGEQPPFTRRMVDIALHLVDGATDRETARALGVSERTVSADVRELSDRLGVRSRARAIALISGVDG